MALRIDLSTETERELRERALAAGKDVDEFVREAVEEKLLRSKSLDELLAPVRAKFERSGMTEEELDALVEEAREEIWREQQLRQARAS